MKLNLATRCAMWFGMVFVVISPLVPSVASAQLYCLCKPTSTVVDVNSPQQIDPNCLQIAAENECVNTPQAKCAVYQDLPSCEKDKTTPAAAAAGTAATQPQKTNNSIVGAVIPACLLEPTLSPQCRDITIFLDLLINIANWAFGVIGAVALLMFVYGGFVLIISQGNAEKVSQGMGILTAAVSGIVVAFAGYLLIQFVGSALDIKSIYQLK